MAAAGLVFDAGCRDATRDAMVKRRRRDADHLRGLKNTHWLAVVLHLCSWLKRSLGGRQRLLNGPSEIVKARTDGRAPNAGFSCPRGYRLRLSIERKTPCVPFSHATNRSRDCSSCGPSVGDPLVNDLVGDAVLNCPLCKWLCDAVQLENGSGASVGRLRCHCGPTNVSRFVIAIVVYAVKGMLKGRSVANISKERYERLTPRLVHTYAAAAVVLVGTVVLVEATRFYVAPDRVFGSVAQAVRLEKATGKLLLETTATWFTGRLQGVGCPDNNRATLAYAHPVREFLGTPGVPSDVQPAEHLAGQVLKLCVGGDRNGLSHDTALSHRVGCGEGRAALTTPRRPVPFLSGGSSSCNVGRAHKWAS